MKTPIADFIRNYCESDTVRLHMPGHKGSGPLGVEKLDITEIDGADVLCSASGIILESEQNAAALFESGRTFYSTEGSSLCIKAMLGAVLIGASKTVSRPFVLAARNVHKAFIYALAAYDLDVRWMYPESGEHFLKCTVDADILDKALSSGEKPIAVYITSPDYLGNVADVRALSDVCKKHKVPLLVDNAHGAYLKFLQPSRHPIDLGADMCCDSAHKTLPVLTGGAYLHISRNAPEELADYAEKMLAFNSSTSPSYLILQSLDLCNKRLAESFSEELADCIEKLKSIGEFLRKLGLKDESEEPLKLALNASKFGITGTELGKRMREFGIEPEFCDDRYAVLMFTPDNNDRDYECCLEFLGTLAPSAELLLAMHDAVPSEQVMTVRSAVLSQSETVDVEQSIGRVCADVTVSCPPAVPIAVSGEIITEKTVEIFKAFKIEKISVVNMSPHNKCP